MIKVKHAPAGVIAQYFTDTHPAPYGYLDVSGGWRFTQEEAVEAVKKEKVKRLKALRAKLKKVQEKLETDIAMLENASDEVIVER